MVGIHDINKPVYAEQKMSVARIFLHEQYNTETQENDIAIIRLAKPVNISDTINVICLPGPEATRTNETVWVGKWTFLFFCTVESEAIYIDLSLI